MSSQLVYIDVLSTMLSPSGYPGDMPLRQWSASMSLDAMASARWRVTFSTASPWPIAGAYTSTRVRALAPVAHGTALLAISHAPTPHATASTTSTATASAHWPAVSDHWPETRYMSAKIWKGCPAWEHTRANVVRIRDTATMIASSILRLGRTVPPRSFTRFDCSFGSTSAKIHFSFQA